MLELRQMFNHLLHSSPWNNHKYSPALSFSIVLDAVRDSKTYKSEHSYSLQSGRKDNPGTHGKLAKNFGV